MYRAVIMVLIACLCGATAQAQQLHVRTYGERDGLPSPTVWDVTQDSNGRIWFATRAGLAAYDGGTWERFGAEQGLAGVTVDVVRAGRDGELWAMSQTPLRLFRLEGAHWQSMPAPPAGESAGGPLLVAPDGRVVVGTNHGAFRWDGRAWDRLGVADGLPGDDVRSLAMVDETLWIGTTRGLVSVSPAGVVDRTPEIPAEKSRAIPALAVGPDGRSVWVVGDAWVGRFDPQGKFAVERALDDPLPRQEFTRNAAAVADLHGGLYFGNATVAYYYHAEEGLTELGRADGLTDGGTTSLLRDREGNVWVTGLRGVSKIVSRRFITYRESHGLLEDEVSAVLERHDGSIVLGHPGGLTVLEGRRMTQVPFDRRRSVPTTLVRVLSLAEDEAGDLWVAANHLGLARLRGDTFAWELPQRSLAVHVDGDGELWAAMEPGGLMRRRDGRFEAVEIDQDLRVVRNFAPSRSGFYLLTPYSGVGRFDGGKIVSHARGDSADADSTYTALEHPDGSVWVGTAAGLMQIDGDRLRPVDDPGPTITRPVYFLTRDLVGRVWCGTDNGVMRWDGLQWKSYTTREGLAGTETNRAAGRVDGLGRVWIGTVTGVSVYRGHWDDTAPPPPFIRFHGLFAGGSNRSLEDDLRLGHRHNDVTFGFRAVSFIDEEHVTVRSRLEGLDADWKEVSGRPLRELRYPRLPAGRYRLHLQAVSAGNTPSRLLVSSWITVARPLWRQPLLLAAGFLLLVAFFYFMHRYLAQRSYARALEAEVERRVERVRQVEAELARSERLGSLAVLASGLAHDFNNLLTVILGNLSLLKLRLKGGDVDLRPVDEATGAVKRATDLTAQFLTFARGGEPVRTVLDLAPIARESAALVLAGRSVDCSIEFPPRLSCAEVDAGQLGQVFNNLLLNAVQAMPEGGKIRLGAENVTEAPTLPAGRYVHFAVEDEGSGISDELRERVFDPFFTTKEGGRGLGLSSAYSIVKRHGGILTIGQATNGGATFHLYLPASDKTPVPEAQPVPVARPVSSRILLMDDDPAVRSVMQAMLKADGFDVASAPEGETAIELFTEARHADRPFDVVILDLTVRGGMGGRQTLEHLRVIDPDVCAIVASGYSDDPVMAHHRDYGFRGAIVKPLSRSDLVQVIKEVSDVG